MDNELAELFANFNITPDSSSSSKETNAVIEENETISEPVISNEESLNTAPAQNNLAGSEQNNNNSYSNSRLHQFLWQTQYSIFHPVLNKPFLVQNNLYVAVIDNSANVFIYLINQYNNQLFPCADVKNESDEFVVYQNGVRLGTLDYTSNPNMLCFVQAGTPAYNQNNIQPSIKANTQQYSYNFSNVPPEQATDIIDSIMKNKPECPVNIDFASQNMPQEIIYADNPEVIDVPADEIIDSPNDTEQ